MDDLARRRSMVENQLRPSNVTDPRVLAAMAEVPRPPFLPANLRAVAYGDDDLRLSDGRFLIEPLVLARLLQFAAPAERDTALVLGCDTGYCAAVLAKLTATVLTLTGPNHLAEVEARIDSLGTVNAFPIASSEPLSGHADQAPYDVILVAGRIPAVPEALTAQLAEGGRLVAVVGSDHIGRGTLVTRVHDHVGTRSLFDAAIPALRGLRSEPVFEF